MFHSTELVVFASRFGNNGRLAFLSEKTAGSVQANARIEFASGIDAGNCLARIYYSK